MAPVVIAVTLGVPLGVLWVIALVDVLHRADWEFPSWQPGSNDRIVWAFVVLILNGIGALVYYFMVMKPYPRQHR
jgi:hypothetical protein